MDTYHEEDIPGSFPGPGEVINDLYRLGRVHASGGMGMIFRAEQLTTGREVAVKLLHPHVAAQEQFTARFLREAKVSTMFEHSNIVRVYDLGETDGGALYLVMELLDGEPLEEVIRCEAPLSVDRIVDVGLQMLDGLGEAHTQEVVHRDMKPSNVFVSKTRHGEDEIKLLDFGVAKFTDVEQTKLTRAGRLVGTPSYVAPEAMLELDDGFGKQADVYAVGLILVEMLMGEEVFLGATVTKTLLRHIKMPVRLPTAVDESPLGEVLRTATMKHPGDRYCDADEMYKALLEARDRLALQFRLKQGQTPQLTPSTTPGFIQQLDASGDEGLEMLRSVPQHIAFDPGDVERTTQVDAPEELGASEPQQTEVNRKATSPDHSVPESKEDDPGRLKRAREATGPLAEFVVVGLVLGLLFFLFGPLGQPTSQGVVIEHLDGAFEPVIVDIEPDGVRVYADDEYLGQTPVHWSRHSDEFPVELVLTKEDHEEETIVVEEGVEMEIVLPAQGALDEADETEEVEVAEDDDE